MKSESFIKGTIILIAANSISKILGAILKIPLTYILGEEGMAIYQTSFSVYIMLLSLISSGLPFAASKYIAEETARNHPGNVRFCMRFSVSVMCMLGFLASAVMFFGADFFAYAMKDPKAPTAIMVLAPSVFFVALGTPYKSCYQGTSHQTPTAISQVAEAFIKLLAGYSLAAWFAPFSVKLSSAAAIGGVTIGEFAATLLLFVFYIPFRRETRSFVPETRRKEIVHSLLAVAVPMSAASVISGCLSLLDTSITRSRLTSIEFTPKAAELFTARYSPFTHIFDALSAERKLSFDGARWIFGAYSGYAATVFNLPAGILASFGIAILPIITRALATSDSLLLSHSIRFATKIILIISLPSSLILCFFSSRILEILFHNTSSAIMLSYLAPLLSIVTLTQFFCSVHHSSGKITAPFIYGLAASLIKIPLSYILIGISYLNILGVIVSNFVCDLIQLILNLRLMKKELKISPITFSDIAKTSLSSIVMLFMSILLFSPLSAIFCNRTIGFFISIALSLLAYIAALFVFGAITKEEISRLCK